MKQRLAIALAIMHNPELLILDEPINGLDPIGIAEVRDFIRELCDATGKTILISSHILSEIALLADDVGIIDHGVLVEEESLEELEAKNGKYFRFTVSNATAAGRLLYERLGIPSLRAQKFYLVGLRWSEEREVRSTSPVHFLSKAAKQQFFFAQGQMIQSFFSRKAVSTMAR